MEASRLCSIRGDKRETDRVFSEAQQFEEPQTPTAREEVAVASPVVKVRETSGEGKG